MDEELQAWCEVAQAEEAALASSRRAASVAMSEEDAAALAALRAQLSARARALGVAALPGAGASSASESAVDGPSDDGAWDGGSGHSGLLDVPGGLGTPSWASDDDIPSSWATMKLSSPNA